MGRNAVFTRGVSYNFPFICPAVGFASGQLDRFLDSRLYCSPYICALPSSMESVGRSGFLLLPVVLLGLGAQLPPSPGFRTPPVGEPDSNDRGIRPVRNN